MRDGFVWNTQTNAVQTLPSLGGDSYPEAVSEDGTVVVGEAYSSLGREAGYWDLESGTVIGLGDLRGGNSSSAYGVSADGSVVVGSANSDSGNQAFLWEAGVGMRSLTDLLENDYGLDLGGWTLWSAVAVSDDGLAIAGEGLNPQGQAEAWLARLPAPNSAPVVTCPSPPHDMLWPPNHDLVPVTLRIIVADDCTDPEDLVVTCSATSDEPDDSTGDGAFIGDVNGRDGYTAPVPVTMTYDAASGFWEATVLLRSERKGKGDGRKYAVRCSASDSANTTTATICVVVPHSQGKGRR